MSKEFEQPRSFRLGESKNRSYGGSILDAPLPRTISKLATSKGFESQRSLAKALGVNSSNVTGWYKHGIIPSPETFDNLLVLLDLNDEEREELVESYTNRLAEREASSRLKRSKKNVRATNNPVGGWIENFCREKGVSISEFNARLEYSLYWKAGNRRNYGLPTLIYILQEAQNKLGLSEEQAASLNEAIDKEIEEKRESGHRFQRGLSGSRLLKEQKILSYRTYNGQQASIELGISREWVSKLRKRFNLPGLLTDEHIKMLKAHLEETKNVREKMKQARERRQFRQAITLVG